MQFTNEISPIVNKKQELRVWLLRNETTMRELADFIGIKAATLCVHLNKSTIPTEHFNKLVNELHVPAHLLPEPMDLKPGPRPKRSEYAADEVHA